MRKEDILCQENENIEVRLLLEAIYRKYGYDFRDYGRAHIKRRVKHRLSLSDFNSISDITHRVLYDQSFFESLLLDFSINVSEMFRDPPVYLAIKRKVIPLLKTYPFVKIWNAGCATGEEVYSIAIILKEEGLYKKCQIYATDFNQIVIQKAKEGIYPVDHVRKYTRNYQSAGGTGSFSDYYTANYGRVIMDKALKENIVFADHNLVTDGAFGEMQLIICRNVLIYFKQKLQNQVVSLFTKSLAPGGFLCLGSKEDLRFSDCYSDYTITAEKEKIYRKRYPE